MKRVFAGIWDWWKTRSVGHRLILIFLVVLVAVFARYLYEGPKPWEDGIAPRVEAGKKVKSEHYAIDGIYTGVIASLVMAVLLVPFAGFFGRPLSGGFPRDEMKRPGMKERLLLLVVVFGSMGILCLYAIPRFSHSLWGDEEVSMRKAIVGDYYRVAPKNGKMLADRFGTVAWKPLGWEETLWFYESPNNHMFYSAVARLMHKMLPPEKGSEKPYFNSTALRLPSLISALLTLAVLAVLLSLMGMRLAAFALPPLLALHPWFIRYASEGRGYGMAFLFVSLVLLFSWKAAATGKWRWFIAMGIAQFCLLYTNLVGLWFLVVLSAAALVGFLVRKGTDKADRGALVGRFLLTNAVFSMAVLIVMWPLKLQLKFGHGEGAYGAEIFKDMACAVFTGMRWETWNPQIDYLVSGERMLADSKWLFLAVVGGLVVLLLVGLFALGRKGWRHGLLIPVIVLPVFLFLGFTLFKNVVLHYWYAVCFLPLFWMAIAIGIGYLSRCIGGKDEGRNAIAGAALILVAVGAFWWLGNGQRQMQIAVPLERSLESVLKTRSVIDPTDPRYEEVLTVGFHKEMRAYDPGVYRVLNGPEMERMLAKADEEGKPLFVNMALPGFARVERAEIMKLVDDPELFELVDELPAMEPTTTRYIFRYKPGSFSARTGRTGEGDPQIPQDPE